MTVLSRAVLCGRIESNEFSIDNVQLLSHLRSSSVLRKELAKRPVWKLKTTASERTP